jgi:hypothetical protein
MIQISICTGTEGPRHDPYHFEEFTVERDGVSVTAHHGLANWVSVEGADKKGYQHETEFQDEVDWIFFSCVGMTEAQARRYQRKAEQARMRPHRHHGGGVWVTGYPGEHLCLCACGAVLDSVFNQSAVE